MTAKTTLYVLSGIVVLLLSLELLGAWLEQSGRIAQLLSPGAHSSTLSLLTGIGFLLLRVTVIVGLPGLVVSASVVCLLRDTPRRTSKRELDGSRQLL